MSVFMSHILEFMIALWQAPGKTKLHVLVGMSDDRASRLATHRSRRPTYGSLNFLSFCILACRESKDLPRGSDTW